MTCRGKCARHGGGRWRGTGIPSDAPHCAFPLPDAGVAGVRWCRGHPGLGLTTQTTTRQDIHLTGERGVENGEDEEQGKKQTKMKILVTMTRIVEEEERQQQRQLQQQQQRRQQQQQQQRQNSSVHTISLYDLSFKLDKRIIGISWRPTCISSSLPPAFLHPHLLSLLPLSPHPNIHTKTLNVHKAVHTIGKIWKAIYRRSHPDEGKLCSLDVHHCDETYLFANAVLRLAASACLAAERQSMLIHMLTWRTRTDIYRHWT